MLRRAFPADAPGAAKRAIIATIDTRAQARYLRAGVYPRFPIYEFNRAPEPVSVPTDLEIKPLTAAADPLALAGAIDTAILGHRRDPDHAWFQATRHGYAYYRNSRPVGYGYLGPFMGPFALLDPADQPAVLAHAETEWHAQGHARIAFETPLINQTAVDYLLARRYQFGGFFAFFMTNVPFGQFDRYICSSPLFFI